MSNVASPHRLRIDYLNRINQLLWAGRDHDARAIAREAVKLGLWKNELQRPGKFFPHLAARPLYDPQEFEFVSVLERSFQTISDEWQACQKSKILADVEEYVYDGSWQQVFLFRFAVESPENTVLFPKTAELIKKIPEAISCTSGVVAISRLAPGTYIRPHCGPTNSRLRLHLGIDVPPNAGMEVAGSPLQWVKGKCLVFDDSFEHKVWNRSDSDRVILILDFWHPQVSSLERRLAAKVQRMKWPASGSGNLAGI